MLKKIQILLNFAIALGVMGVFVFSAAQATAYASCPECQPYPDTACAHIPNKDDYCQSFCLEYFCEDGFCEDQMDKCICTEK